MTVAVTVGAGEGESRLGAVARPTRPPATPIAAARTTAQPGGMSHRRLSACSLAAWAEAPEDDFDFTTGPLWQVMALSRRLMPIRYHMSGIALASSTGQSPIHRPARERGELSLPGQLKLVLWAAGFQVTSKPALTRCRLPDNCATCDNVLICRDEERLLSAKGSLTLSRSHSFAGFHPLTCRFVLVRS